MNIPRKYRDDALLERRIKFVFSSNHPLIIDGEDEALMKRIVYLPFNYAIPDDQQDPDLGDKIWAERDAVVTKALYYARKLVQRNYIFPEIPYVDSAKYSPVKRLVQEICDKDLCEAEMTENLCRKSIKNAVEVKEYQILYRLRELRQKIGNAKMTFGIFDTERKEL